MPKEFGNDSSGYCVFARWESRGISDIRWAILPAKCDDLQDVDWQWQSAAGCLGKASSVDRSGFCKREHKTGTSVPNPLTAPKSGVKKSVLVEGHRRPLAACVSRENVLDSKLPKATLEAIVVVRSTPTAEKLQHFCLDKGYDTK